MEDRQGVRTAEAGNTRLLLCDAGHADVGLLLGLEPKQAPLGGLLLADAGHLAHTGGAVQDLAVVRIEPGAAQGAVGNALADNCRLQKTLQRCKPLDLATSFEDPSERNHVSVNSSRGFDG